ncbi:MAG: helix-turn-helix domain-containing protein [Nibricoccus sp.]
MNTENIMDCSSRIKLERQKRSWTQEQLAERAKLSARTVQRIECGADASAETLRLIAEAFGISAESLRATAVRSHFRAPWARSVTAVTIGVVLFTIAFSVLPLSLAKFTTPPRFIVYSAILNWLLWAVVCFSLFFGVNGYSIRQGKLLVHRLGWATKFDLAQLSGFEANPHAMMGSIRLFGNGGIFCFHGYFRNAILGRYKAYVTNPALCVVLEFGERKIVISPDDPQTFVEALRDASRGICKE